MLSGWQLRLFFTTFYHILPPFMAKKQPRQFIWVLSFTTDKQVISTAFMLNKAMDGTDKGDYTLEECSKLNRIRAGIPPPEFAEDWIVAREQLIEYSNLIKSKLNGERQL